MMDPQQTHEGNEVMPEETSETAAPAQTDEAQAAASDGDVPEEGTAPAPGPRDFFGLQSFLNVLVVVIFVITFVVQAFRVPSESMENTLLVGDFILADKLHFGQDGGLWHTILPYRPIRHGDIVVFRYPVDPSQYFVKRVVGLPGDRIHLSGGTVYLNGKRQDESYVIHSFPYPNFYRDNFPTEGYMSPETDRKWRLQMLQYVKDGDLVVPPDSYFVMGDNRDRSLDSRYWGFVPRGNITARPLVIYMSVNERDDTTSSTPGGKLIHSGHTLTHFLQLARWGRMFRLVH